MVLFNTTFHVHKSVDEAFHQWIRHNYIPAALKSGLLTTPIFSRIMVELDPDAQSYALQFTAMSETEADKWSQEVATIHLGELADKYGETILHFSTKMEILQP